MSLFDWLGRVTLLVLSGLATLSIIASLAAVSDLRGLPDDAGAPRTGIATRPSVKEGMAGVSMEAAPPSASDEAASGTAGSTTVAVPVPPPDPVERWLEALTYAVLALAGFVAAGVIVLLRITALIARIAER